VSPALGVALALLMALPASAAAQAGGGGADAERSPGLEASGGVALPSGDLAAFAEPGLSAGAALTVPLADGVSLRVEGELDLPERDASAAPLINVYAATAGIEYAARQEDPDRLPLRTALSLGAGVSVVEAAEMPAGAPAGAVFRESYLSLSAGARLGYPLTSSLSLYLAPGVRWFDLPPEDADRLTAGVGAPAPENGWMVPVRAGVRLAL
jgi:hypothetical protein